jgi:hypothetical protein
MENRDAGGDDLMATDLNRESPKGTPQPPVDERLQRALDKVLYADGSPEAQKLRNFLNGTWLGEPLHVVLTDLPVGAWTVAMVFDLLDLVLDRREFASAADASIGIGLVGAAGAAPQIPPQSVSPMQSTPAQTLLHSINRMNKNHVKYSVKRFLVSLETRTVESPLHFRTALAD